MAFVLKKRNSVYSNIQSTQRSFQWLISCLVSNNERVKGCELIFQDTVFFKNGEVHSLVKMDKEFCLIAQRNKKKLYLQAVLKHIQDAFAKNKKDNKGVFILKYGNNVFDDVDQKDNQIKVK